MSKPVPTTAQPSKKYVAFKRSQLNPAVKSRTAAFPSMPDAGSLSMPDASSLTPDWDEQCGKFACPKCAPLCVPIQMFKWCFIILLAPLIAICLVFSSPLLFWVSAGKDAAKVAGGKPGKFLTAASDVLFWLFMPLMLEEYCIFKMTGYKAVPLTWYGPDGENGEKFSIDFSSFAAFKGSFANIFCGESESDDQSGAGPSGAPSVAEKLDLSSHFGSMSSPGFSALACFTQPLKWFLAVPLILCSLVGFAFTIWPYIIVRSVGPKPGNKSAAGLGCVCLALTSPVLACEIGVVWLIGLKLPPLGTFCCESVEKPTFKDLINPLSGAKIYTGTGGEADEADAATLLSAQI